MNHAAGLEALFWMIFGGFILICWLLAEVCERKEKDLLPAPRMDTVARGPIESWEAGVGRVRTP